MARLKGRAFAAVVAGLALALAACTSGGGTAGTAQGGKSNDGTLQIALGNFPPSGVPWAGVGSPGQYVWDAVFDALTRIDADGNVAPGLATEWESVDKTTWEFALREGVEFSNGEPLDADAVVATFDILLSEKGQSTYSAHVGNYSSVDEVRAVDERTVRVTTSEPDPLLPAALSIVYIVPPEYWAEAGAEEFATAPIGTGPFKVEQWDSNTIALGAYGDSWRNTNVADVEFLHLEDPASRVQALRSGQIDVVTGASPDQLKGLEGDDFNVFASHNGRLMSLIFATENSEPLQDERVRLALNYAVDKKTIAQELVAGYTAPTAWPPKGVNGYDPERAPIPYDPQRARQLLQEAGHGDGFDLVAEITTGSFPADRQIYEAVAGYLGEVGVNLELKEIDFASEWLPKFSGSGDKTWIGGAAGSTWNAPPLMDAIRPFAWNSCGWVNEWYCDPVAEEMINEVNSTFDDDARAKQLAELLDHTMTHPPALFLVELVDLWATAPGVEGLSVNAFNISWEDIEVGGG